MLSSPLPELITLLSENQELNGNQIAESIDALTNPDVQESEKLEFLTAMTEKGETEFEFSHFVREFRKRAISPELDEFSTRAIDLCGTGGDQAGSFNISTFVSFLVASAGIPVIKHGNRSISSKCGSADLLEAVGIPLAPAKEKLKEGLKSLNFGFLFAPQYHPAFKHIAPVRKRLAEKGILTFFNVMGPMINPARPSYQLVGSFDPNYLRPMAKALETNNLKSGLIAHCQIEDDEITSVDELTACGENLVFGFGRTQTTEVEKWHPSEWNQEEYPIRHLKGGDLSENIKIMKNILDGDCFPGLTATILVNAATAFLICERVESLGEGVELAESLIQDGKVKKWLDLTSDFFA